MYSFWYFGCYGNNLQPNPWQRPNLQNFGQTFNYKVVYNQILNNFVIKNSSLKL